MLRKSWSLLLPLARRYSLAAARPGILTSGLLILVILASACLPNLAPKPAPGGGPNNATPAPMAQIPVTTINFNVTIPADTPAGDPIFLTVLDEVTGAALNSKTYTMTATTGVTGTFTASIAFPMGSAVTYRYERQSNANRVQEHVSAGTPVRYRLYHVDGPGTENDIVSRWTDTQFNLPNGRIIGQATDAESGQPLAGLLVTAGGAQTFTAADGTFLLEGLPAGVHTLVALAPDGAYRTFQQGARVAAGAATPAVLKMQSAPLVNLVFVVSLPEDTPPIVPVRLAGSLYQAGNTFAPLSGGISTLAANMPVLKRLPDGRFTLTLTLPAGADLRYKYTLGDGFWNAEHTQGGALRLRQVVVPNKNTLINDMVETWHSGREPAMTFDVSVPANTPPGDFVSIQFNPIFGWTEPIPMWKLGPQRWAYILYSPLNLPGNLSYRYCRNNQCGSADDASTPGLYGEGRPAKDGGQAQVFKDEVKAWQWLGVTQVETATLPAEIPARMKNFVAGLQMGDNYHPSWRAALGEVPAQVKAEQANWLFYAPTWSFTRSDPPVLEPVAGSDPLWLEAAGLIEQTTQQGVKVALAPGARFPVGQSADAWWQTAARDEAWWNAWFERYTAFAMDHAELAARSGAGALILGGDWLAPALPGGTLVDGSPSGVPDDADTRWRDLIHEVRSAYKGALLWALPFAGMQRPPAFLEAVDGIYLLWNQPLALQAGVGADNLEVEAGRLLDSEVKPFRDQVNKPIILAVAYPSVTDGNTGCVPSSDPARLCADLATLDPAAPDQPDLAVDLQDQYNAYAAMLQAVNQRPWIAGFVSQGYNPLVALQDKSISVHGKPAGELLKEWFTRFVTKSGD